MSRSYKRTPKGTTFSDKDWKREYNRRLRSSVRTKMKSVHHEEIDDLVLPTKHIHYSDCWDSKADGNTGWFGNMNSDRQEYSPWMVYNYSLSEEYGIYNKVQAEEICRLFNLSDNMLYIINTYVQQYGQYYYRRPIYDLRYTPEENIQNNKKLFKKMMRK